MTLVWVPDVATFPRRYLGDLCMAAMIAVRTDRGDLLTQALYKIGDLVREPSLRAAVWS